ncbi:MAG TPA: MnhB domain-containing protein, partial [Spirochaetales bacterium]|nr:MnhB domain-containing protein [Spirochaetales bacterium]
IINFVAGKLAPIVLLFGTYVMLYGHTSPGGGFQGGVVLASGVIFIAIGRRAGGIGRISPSITAFGPRTLSVIEAIAFATVLALSFPGSGAALAGLIEATGASAGVAAKGVAAVGPIIALNIGIGLKVGSGVALLCVMMLGGDQE